MLFANDTSVFLEGTEYTHLNEILNSELKKTNNLVKCQQTYCEGEKNPH